MFQFQTLKYRQIKSWLEEEGYRWIDHSDQIISGCGFCISDYTGLHEWFVSNNIDPSSEEGINVAYFITIMDIYESYGIPRNREIGDSGI